MADEVNLELTKIYSKIMQSSYKRKEIEEIFKRIVEKVDSKLTRTKNDDEVRALRMEFEQIRKDIYGL